MTRFILAAFLFVAGCNSTDSSTEASSTTSTDDTSVITSAAPDLAGCYAWTVNKDSAYMKISVEGNIVEGTLVYNWAEKDRNSGTLQGTVQDSLIVADYTFNSEGTRSVRQVVFKIHNGSLIEGFGDIDTNGHTARFKNIAGLQFQNERPFAKTECNE